MRYKFLVDLESIQHKLSSNYSLNICFSRRTNPYKMSIFQRSVTCSFFRNCTHILTRTQGKKFEDMFLVKIASKGTSLSPHLETVVIVQFKNEVTWISCCVQDERCTHSVAL